MTSRRRENVKQRPNDAAHHSEVIAHSESNCFLVFRHLGVEGHCKEVKPQHFGSNLPALGNNVQIPPLHETSKENNVAQQQEVNEILARLV